MTLDKNLCSSLPVFYSLEYGNPDYDDGNMAWAWQTLEDLGFIISSHSLIEEYAGIVLGKEGNEGYLIVF